MLCRIDFTPKSFSGYGLSDGKCFPCSGLSGRLVNLSPRSLRGNGNKFGNVKFLCQESTTRSTSFVCNASSVNPRRNPDFSKYNKQGTSRSRNRQNEDLDDHENLEEYDMFSSKNGPLLAASNASKVQSTATPGPREKKIIELFRKVQAQLRERAGAKAEKKVELSTGKGNESETVDSLLKLLRKHSVQKGKKASSNTDFILDQTSPTDGFSDSIEPKSVLKNENQESEAPVMDRPKSTFIRRSPVSRGKIQPSFSEVLNSVPSADTDGEGNKISLEPKSLNATKGKVESITEPIFSDEDVFDELSEDESADIHEEGDDDDDGDNDEKHNQVGADKLDDMTVLELRALAKSGGVKGYSKMKKVELVKLLGKV